MPRSNRACRSASKLRRRSLGTIFIFGSPQRRRVRGEKGPLLCTASVVRRKSRTFSRAVPLDRAGSPDPARPDLGVGLRLGGAALHSLSNHALFSPHYTSSQNFRAPRRFLKKCSLPNRVPKGRQMSAHGVSRGTASIYPQPLQGRQKSPYAVWLRLCRAALRLCGESL
jgi:hypothetical protein